MAKPSSKQKSEMAELSVPPKELQHLYREMLLIRRFEEKAGQLYGMGLIQGFCHLYIGQEAVVIGMQAVFCGPMLNLTLQIRPQQESPSAHRAPS